MANQAVKIDGVWRILRIAGWTFVALLLLLPAVAMRFTNEVVWSTSDFVVMGALLGTIGLTTEYLVRRAGSTAYRIGAIVAMATAFLTIWVNLAVGMIGDDNPYNLLFGGVLLLAMTGALIARLKAAGMAATMVATAAAQGLVAAGGISTDLRGALLSMAFVLPWLLSAALFHRAARER